MRKYSDDSIGEGIKVGFNQTLDNYLKVFVGNDISNLTKYDKKQIIDTTILKHLNVDCYLLEQWSINCIDRNGNGELQNLTKSSNGKTPTPEKGHSPTPPIANSFMYIKTSAKNYAANDYCRFERTDYIQFYKLVSIINGFQHEVINQ